MPCHCLSPDHLKPDAGGGEVVEPLGEAHVLVGHCVADAAPDADLFGPGVGLGLRKEDAALLQRLNGALAELVKAKALVGITQKWHLDNKIILPSAQ